LTKHVQPSDDAHFNLSIPLEDGVKADPDIIDLFDKNTLSLCASQSTPIKSRQASKRKSALLDNRTKSKTQTVKTRLGKIMNKLYNLEPTTQPEKPLNIDFGVDLYQMEDL